MESDRKSEVINFGCRLNIYEGELIKQNLKIADRTNVAVFNTCNVTNDAKRQAKQQIRKFKRDNPDVEIIVTGCAAQLTPGEFSEMAEVSYVMGNKEKLSPEYYKKSDERVCVSDISDFREVSEHFVEHFESHSRAFLQVQNGCDHRCTFCTIPFARGPSRSSAIGTIIEQAKRFVSAGYKEIVLTGVDISDYGKDLPGQPTLGQMMKRLLRLVPDLPRLRLSSIDVAEVDEDIFDLMANEERLMPYMHISLQAGDDMILKRMKRRHSRNDVLVFCEKMRHIRPDIAFGADMIAGFPTETEAMFQNSLNLVHEAGLVFLHVFNYSPLDNTPSSKMPQVGESIRKERATMLRSAGDAELEQFLQSMVGRTSNVLIESSKDENVYVGHCENFAKVKIFVAAAKSASKISKNQIYNVKFDSTDGKILYGYAL